MVDFEPFRNITDVGNERERRQYRLELLIRFIVLRNFEYTSDVDVHRYLDRGMVALLGEPEFDWNLERKLFEKTMAILEKAAGADAFRTNKRFSLGKYEFASLGVSRLIESDKALDMAFIKDKLDQIADLPAAKKYSGGGVRGTTRLSKFVMPFAEQHFTE